jgi:hypothetical protein
MVMDELIVRCVPTLDRDCSNLTIDNEFVQLMMQK